MDNLSLLAEVKGPLLFGWLALLFLLERLRPAARPAAPGAGEPPMGAARLLRNGGLWLLNSLLYFGLVLPITLFAASQAPDWRPDWWSGPGALLLDLVLLDFWIYWWHRANHRLPFLWRFHTVHHYDRFLDVSTAVRFHFGEVALSAGARAAVIWLADLPIASVLLFEALVLAAAAFHHSNLRLPPRVEAAIARVLVTPSIHWVHHHARRSDTDANYATIFSFWDPLFSSRSRTRRQPDMRIGVEGGRERGYLELLKAPFLPQG